MTHLYTRLCSLSSIAIRASALALALTSPLAGADVLPDSAKLYDVAAKRSRIEVVRPMTMQFGAESKFAAEKARGNENWRSNWRWNMSSQSSLFSSHCEIYRLSTGTKSDEE